MPGTRGENFFFLLRQATEKKFRILKDEIIAIKKK